MPANALRLFVAMPVPASIQLYLTRQLGNSPLTGNPHITLNFIGNAADAMPYLMELGNIRDAHINLELTKFFQIRKGLVAAGINLSPELELLKIRIDASLRKLGHEPEARKFLPHITVGRRMPPFRAARLHAAWQADCFCLYRSILKPSGAEHIELGRFPLGGDK